MIKEKSGKEIAEELSNFVNNYGCDEKDFVEQVMKEHRTLQQSICRLFIRCCEEWSKQEHYDLRNEGTIKLSKEIMKLDFYLPLM